MANEDIISSAEAAALIHRCDTFLQSITTIDTQFLSEDAQLLNARAKFGTVLEIIAWAERENVISDETFMRDKSGHDHFIGRAAQITRNPEGGTPLIANGELSREFSYKADCRLPVRTVKNAAVATLKRVPLRLEQ